VAAFENRQLVTEAKFINKSSLFMPLLNVIRLLELKLITEQKLRIYSSPQHIAKPPVVRLAFLFHWLQSDYNLSFLFWFWTF